MKRAIFFIAIITVLIAGVTLTGCRRVLITGEDGQLTTKEYSFTGFTVVDVGSAFKVTITPSEAYRVKITAGETIFKNIRVVQAGNTLRIGTEGFYFPLGERTLLAEITMPELLGLDLSGASKGTARGFKTSRDFKADISGASTLDAEMETGRFDMEVSGASEIVARVKSASAAIEQSGASTLNLDMETGSFVHELSGASEASGTLKASNIAIDVTGASEVRLTGSVGNLVLTGSGASEINLAGFNIKDADINLSGATHAAIDITGKLNVTLSGASELKYGGNPTLGERIDISGGSKLEKR
ncbi:MAG: hypothetical protein A2137_03145 [Chloroflexi bacterium RBG_16_58_8]|nr:MAG: hypothetical protein A2137_03145 [Chloroflexi bacterium RBG_16_58_8]